MNLELFEHPYQGDIKIIDFDIRKLRELSRNDYLKSIWLENRMSETPIIIKAPFMKTNIWKRISLTNIYLTCDSLDRKIEDELRNILAPQPNIFQRIYIVVNNIFSKSPIEIIDRLFPEPTLIQFS